MRHLIFLWALLIANFFCGCGHRSFPPAPQPAPYPVSKQPQTRPVLILEPVAINISMKKRPIDKVVIMLDAGHGGEDFGTHSLGIPTYQEKNLNLSTTVIVKNLLQQFGYEVILTRQDDTFISLDKRASFANEEKPKLFVSIHFNSAPSKEAEGIEVFYYQNEENKARMNKSKSLAQSVLDKTTQNTQARSRGVKHGNYAVIRETQMPAILIEGGFLTNENEMEKIKNAAYLKSLALGIAQGIQEYLGKETLLSDR